MGRGGGIREGNGRGEEVKGMEGSESVGVIPLGALVLHFEEEQLPATVRLAIVEQNCTKTAKEIGEPLTKATL